MTNEELVEAIQAGDRVAVEQLWLQCERLIGGIAYRWKMWRPDQLAEVEDLKQSGYFAMMRAVRAYDAEKGYKFTTYLSLSCRNEFRKVLGIRTSRRDASMYAISLDAPIGAGDDEEVTLEGTLSDPNAERQFEERENEDFTQIAHETLARESKQELTDKKRRAIEMLFFEGASPTDVAAQMGISPQALDQQCRAAYRVLRQKPAIQSLFHTITGRDEAPDIASLGISKTGAGFFKGTGESSVERAAFLLVRYEEDRKHRTERSTSLTDEGQPASGTDEA